MSNSCVACLYFFYFFQKCVDKYFLLWYCICVRKIQQQNLTTKGEVKMYYGELEEQVKMETLKRLKEHGELKDRWCQGPLPR